MTVVAFRAARPRRLNIYALNDLMSQRGWHLSALQLPPALHMCFTGQHASIVDSLLKVWSSSCKPWHIPLALACAFGRKAALQAILHAGCTRASPASTPAFLAAFSRYMVCSWYQMATTAAVPGRSDQVSCACAILASVLSSNVFYCRGAQAPSQVLHANASFQ